MPKTVGIVGAGVAGLTAAHELALRGYECTLYERAAREPHLLSIGGKCRTQYFGDPPLPGEHGFRFFPGFYLHLLDTLNRIPLGPDGVPADPRTPFDASVRDHLRETSTMGFSAPGTFDRLPRHPPGQVDDIVDMAGFMVRRVLDVGPLDLFRVLRGLLQFYFSSDDRRRRDYDGRTLAEALGLTNGSPEAKRLVRRLPHMLVAMDGGVGNACTLLNLLYLMSLGFVSELPDHVLNGPTTAVWLEPWHNWLTDLGVRFVFGVEARRLTVEDDRVSGIEFDSLRAEHDFFVLAVPIEAAQQILSTLPGENPYALRFRDGDISGMTAWMVGAQYFLDCARQDFPGHIGYLDSAWAVTSVNQGQFWDAGYLGPLRDRGILEIVSAIACDWKTRGPGGRPATGSTMRQVLDGIRAQVQAAQSPPGTHTYPHGATTLAEHLDDELVYDARGRINGNLAPLLIHPRGQWGLRPRAVNAGLSNLVLASDYVRTSIDLATMEGANEAARHAVNGILSRDPDGPTPPPVPTWNHLEVFEPAAFRYARNGFTAGQAKVSAHSFAIDPTKVEDLGDLMFEAVGPVERTEADFDVVLGRLKAIERGVTRGVINTSPA